jgi:xylulokinase
LRSGTSRPGLARAAFDGVACSALDAIDQLTDAGATWDGDEPLRLTGPEPGLEAHAQVLATLADRSVVPGPAGSLAAAGACVQAAAVLAEEDPSAVAEAWDLGAGAWVEPEDDPTRMVRRLAHAEERSRQRRALLDPT